MFPYLFAFFSTLFLSFFSNSKYRNFFLFFLYLILILLVSLRSLNVGTDTENYFEIFNQAKLGEIFSFNLEPFYLLLNVLCKTLYNNFSFYLFVFSSFFIFIWSVIFKKLSYDYTVAIIFFLTFFAYFSFFNITRQSFAMSLCLLSLFYLFDKKYYKYLFLILIASCFHYSAIIFIITLFIFKFVRNPFFSLIISFASTYFLSNFILFYLVNSSLKNSYLNYGGQLDDISGLFLIGFLVIQFIFFSFFRFFLIPSNKLFSNLFNIFSFGLGFFLACKFLRFLDDGPTRLTFYFLLVNIFLFSIAIHSIVNNKVKFTAKILFIVFCFIYFLNYLLSGAGGLYPYFFDEQFRIF